MAQSTAQPPIPHKLVLDHRSTLKVDGVQEVVRFDDTTVVLKTTQGILWIGGQNLKLRSLTLEGGQVAVDGLVDLLQYEEPKDPTGSFLRRLFRP